MATNSNNVTVRTMRDGARGKKGSMILLVIGVILFVLGFRYERFDVGGLGGGLMLVGLALIFVPVLWNKVKDRRSARYFRSVSQIIWKKDPEREYEEN